MGKIITLEEAYLLSDKLNQEGKTIVLAGGCFDFLHVGHIIFLKKAKEKGDILMVLLEDDRKIRERKGETRPIHNQNDRATVLSALSVVDYVVTLPYLKDDSSYENLVLRIKPAIIPMTENDRYANQKKAHAEKVGGKAIFVTPLIENRSSSRVAKSLEKTV